MPAAVESWDEGATLEFKDRFDPRSTGDWCELIKDIIAMANSGGGSIVVGANDDGTTSGHDISALLAIDIADFINKIHKYIEVQFSGFRVFPITRAGSLYAVLEIEGVRFPMVFSAPGTYETGVGGRQKTAFGKGTVYFRHGAKSEAGSSEDLRTALERELERVKSFWLEGITKVVQAPAGSEVQIIQQAVSLMPANDETQKIRLTTEGDSPEFRVVDNDQLYPYRSKELVRQLNEKLPSKTVSTYDIQVVRKVHGVDDNPNFSHKGKFATRQYSDAFVEWVASEYEKNHSFFEKARSASRSMTRE
jgi:hypothetical protein